MKLRLQGSTLRLRLRRSEVEQLMSSGRVEEIVQFGAGPVVYSLVLDDDATAPCAEMIAGEIRVRLPRAQGLAWGNGSETGITSPDVTPTVLIERDFVRTAVEEPDDFDRFTNPRSGRRPPPR
jgi:hypothetical protein